MSKKEANLEAYYGLPHDVKFCKKCCYSNQRPSSTKEFQHTAESKKLTLAFDEDGVCDACRLAAKKHEINWQEREEQLLELLSRHRKTDGSYDCIVPGSGGKDSVYAAHVLKYKYKMNPLTVTWPPILYTTYGWQNFRNWIEVGGFDNISFNQNGRAMRALTRLSIENLFHPFQTFILGQKQLAPKIALKYGIPLVFYGEHEAEFGNPIAESQNSLQNNEFHTIDSIDDVVLGGVPIGELRDRYELSLADLRTFLPMPREEYEKGEVNVHYLGYYLKWQPQESYYYAVENSGFRARPFRTEGTYSKYLSLDDKIDDLNYYCYFIKFGFGRCSEDASQEIRNGHITRDEGKALVGRYDGEFPERYFHDVMNYIGMDPDYFRHELTDRFRSPHLWVKVNGVWQLRHNINGTGYND